MSSVLGGYSTWYMVGVHNCLLNELHEVFYVRSMKHNRDLNSTQKYFFFAFSHNSEALMFCNISIKENSGTLCIRALVVNKSMLVSQNRVYIYIYRF